MSTLRVFHRFGARLESTGSCSLNFVVRYVLGEAQTHHARACRRQTHSGERHQRSRYGQVEPLGKVRGVRVNMPAECGRTVLGLPSAEDQRLARFGPAGGGSGIELFPELLLQRLLVDEASYRNIFHS